MRLFLLICMIALMPLRAGAGDLMVVQMAQDGARTGSGSASSSMVAAHADCDEHRHAQSTQGAGKSTAPVHSAYGHCASCVSCPMCFSVAWVVPVSGHPAIALSYGMPWANGASYTSAVLALGQKPPIS